MNCSARQIGGATARRPRRDHPCKAALATSRQWVLPQSHFPIARRLGSALNVYCMNRQQLLDLYFLDARAKLIDIAALLDRLDLAQGQADFRLDAFTHALGELQRGDARRAERVLLSLSDPTSEPIPVAQSKAACGAWPGQP
jgi:hypothetical protein